MAENDYSNNTQKLTDIELLFGRLIGQEKDNNKNNDNKFVIIWITAYVTPGVVFKLEKCLRRSNRMLEIWKQKLALKIIMLVIRR